MVEQIEALLVGDAGEGVVWVFAFEVDDQLREFVVVAELLDRVGEGLPADDGAEITPGVVAVDGCLDAPFQVRRPSLVQLEVLPAGVADQVSRPGMGELVGDDVDVLAVVRDDGRGGEGEDGVFHAAVGEGRG